MRSLFALLLLSLALSGCGDLAGPAAPGEAPSAFRGVWGADCDRPFIHLEARRIRVFADPAAYDLTGAVQAADDLRLSYLTPQGPVSETYVKAGDTLRLAAGTYAAGPGKPAVTVTWNKAPMKRCPAQAAPRA